MDLQRGFSILLVWLLLVHLLLPTTGCRRVEPREDNLEHLRSLPYTSWSGKRSDEKKSGVILNNPELAAQGVNLYTDDYRSAFLMDMGGRILHRWTFPHPGKWEHVELLDDGTIAGISVNASFAVLDKNSQVLLLEKINPHHDIAVLPDGDFLIPVYSPPQRYNGRLVQFENLLQLTRKGQRATR